MGHQQVRLGIGSGGERNSLAPSYKILLGITKLCHADSNVFHVVVLHRPMLIQRFRDKMIKQNGISIWQEIATIYVSQRGEEERR